MRARASASAGTTAWLVTSPVPRSSASARSISSCIARERSVRRRATSSLSAASPGAGSSGSSCASFAASQELTIRTSSTSSTGTADRAAAAPPRARPRCAPRSSPTSGSGPQSRTRPRDDPEGVEAALRRVAGKHQARAGVGGAQHAAEAREQVGQALEAPAQHLGALVAALAGRLLHALLDVAEQQPARLLGTLEQRQRLVEAAAVGVRVEVAEAGRHAAAHLPVDRGVQAARQATAAVAQPEERLELADQLLGRGLAAHRADVHRQAGGRLRRQLEHRIVEVEAAAQVEPAVGALQPLVAGRLPGLDQAVLEHERAQLRVRGLVVHHLGLLGPARRARRSASGRGCAPTPTCPRRAACPAGPGRRRRLGRRAAC